MQIRLTVVDPLGPLPQGGRAVRRDVLVTAPAGTALATVASGLASAVSGGPEAGREGGAPVVLYAGPERLDARRCTLGEPPLVDGAVLSLGAPAAPEPHPELDDAPAQLHVVAGPDAGGVHLLHGGRITIGRSADADVPLDDPDVSRLHCAVTVAADGGVSVADLGSTNGTALDGARVHDRPVRFAPGALLRIGESALRLTPSGGPGARMETTPDGEGCVRVTSGGGGSAGDAAGAGHGHEAAAREGYGGGDAAGTAPGATGHARVEHDGAGAAAGPGTAGHGRPERGGAAAEGGDGGQGGGAAAAGHARGDAAGGPTRHAYGTGGWAGQEHGAAEPPVVPGQGGAPRIESRGGMPGGVPAPRGATSTTTGDSGVTHGGRFGAGAPDAFGTAAHGTAPDGAPSGARARGDRAGTRADGDQYDADASAGSTRKGTPLRGTDIPQGMRRRGGIGAWARRLAGGRGEASAPGRQAYGTYGVDGTGAYPPGGPQQPETWPDPAALLLTALGPGPRLWEREPGHPEALTVRLGTADRAAPDGRGLLPAVPVTAGLREAGALGLAGPRARLSGLARAVLAQLAALHSPDTLEIVLISADRSRPLEERIAEWSWLGWLPHLRPAHGQDCRLLLAYDREQAAARTEELLRRVDDLAADGGRTPAEEQRPGRDASRPGGDFGAGERSRGGEDRAPDAGAVGHRAPAADPRPERGPSWAGEDAGADVTGGFPGPYTVVVVDGDPGGAALRDEVARLAVEGPRAGVHVLCLAETAPASPVSPVTETYEAACAVAPTFRACGAVALLGGDVATALHLMRVAPTGPVAPGTVAAVDAVSPAWAERFARAMAPLRTDGTGGDRHPRVATPLPRSARLLDELGLARATPASLMARWADAADDAESLGGRARTVLGAGPRGPLGADLVTEGPHLLVEGPPGSGRTELLRALVASLAAAERPDRLGVVLIDGRDGVGTAGGHGEGLRVCTDIPHVTTHLTANDPVRMREFAQSLSAELKRRAELLGRAGFAEWHAHRELPGRIVAPRAATGRPAAAGNGDIDSPPSSTLRLRPAASARQRTDAAPPLPRLVVVVDDLDALVSPALGSPGRPAAGSVMRALEAVAKEGGRLGVHLVAAAAVGGRTAQTEPARQAGLRVTLDAPAPGPEEPAPGRGRLASPDGRVTAFQGGRVTGRIPRTATQRPTVVALDWHRMGDPPARRPVRELGNGPTDLALLASAVERAAREVSATRIPSLL